MAKSNALQNILGKLTFNLRTLQDYSKDCNPHSSRITDSPNLWTSIQRFWGHREIASEPRWGAEGRPGTEGQGRPWSPAPRLLLASPSGWETWMSARQCSHVASLGGFMSFLPFREDMTPFPETNPDIFSGWSWCVGKSSRKCVCQPLFNLLCQLRDWKPEGSISRGQSRPKKLLEDGTASSFSQQGCASPCGRGVLA